MRAKNEPKSTVSEGEFSEIRSALEDILERSERGVEGAARGGALGAQVRRRRNGVSLESAPWLEK